MNDAMAKEAIGLKKRRDLRSELTSLPVLNYFTTTYDNIKSKHALFQTGLGMVESGFNKIGSRLLSYVDDPGELETMAVNYVRQAKENYPIIKKTPKGIYRKTKNNVIEWSLKKTQTVLQTAPGKVVVWSVGAASSLSDKALSAAHYITNTKPPEKKLSKEKQGKQVVLKSPQRKRRNSLKDKTCSFVECTVVLPIQVTSKILQTVHLWLHLLLADAEEQNRKKQQSLSPAKAEEIKNRRKVSPRKRTKTSAIKSWSKSAVHFFGLDRILPFFKPKSFLKNIDPTLKDSSPNKSDDSEKKRKFDDILSDSDDDEPSYLDHLKRFDLSHYISDEDPDYEPSQESTDNDEYLMGETDSDEDLTSLSPPHPSNTLAPRNRGMQSVQSSTPSKTKTEKIVTNQQSGKESESLKAKIKTNNNEKGKSDESKDVVQLTFKASRLDSKDLNGKSDPYLTLKKQSQDGKWQLIHKTEYIPNSCDPSWRPFSVPLLSLWNGDKSKQIKIAVYDNDTFDDDFVGEAIVTLEEILKASKQEVTWNIINQKKQSKKKNYLNSGQVHLVSCKGNTDLIHVKKSTIVSVSVGLSVSATIILAFLVSHF